MPTAGKVRGVHLNFAVDCATDNGQVRLEFSKVPTNQIAVNGALDPFLEIGTFQNFVTSGMSTPGAAATFLPLDVDVRQGEIIYVHATVSGTATYYVTAVFSYS